MSDTDSDNTALSNNVVAFQNRDMAVWARGPNISNMTSLSFGQSRYGPSAYDQRMMYSRRETSPVSMRSEIIPRTFERPRPLHRGMSSQRSLLNGRSRSPTSSIASSASVADIAVAIKNGELPERDIQTIIQALKRYKKQRIRRKVEKRRRLGHFTIAHRRGSAREYGEQTSDSSLSNDDCRSVRSSVLKEKLSSCRSTRSEIITTTQSTFQDRNLRRNSPENVTQKSFQNMFTVPTSKLVQNKSKPYSGQLLQKDRFKNGFLLPSQRFDNSLASVTIPEGAEKGHENPVHKTKNSNNLKTVKATTQTSDSDQEEIFSKTMRNNSVEKQTMHKKNLIQTTNKISPIKKIQCDKPTKAYNYEMDDFVFAKPAFPVRKLGNAPKEKIIAKSGPPLTETLPFNSQIEPVETAQETIQDKHNNTSQSSISDISSKPSFIKRKLFTQKLDVANKNNVSSENLINSPQTVYGKIQKEKNKIRKLVTSQSCLNTDLLGDDNNYLDLIHKIVPADKLNLTTQTVKSKIQNKKLEESEDRWDVASVLSVCKNDSLSDTYTDEEIFAEDNTKCKSIEKNNIKKPEIVKENNKPPKNVNINNPIKKNCKIVLEKIQPMNETVQPAKQKNFDKPQINKNGIINNNIKSSTKSFWDTDIESDMETLMAPKKKIYPKEMVQSAPTKTMVKPPVQIDESSKENVMPPPEIKTTVDKNLTVNLQRFNTKNFRVKSHRDPSVKKIDIKETLKSSVLQQSGVKTLNSKNICETSVETTETNLITPNKSNTKRKRGGTTPVKNSAKKAKITTKENDSMSVGKATKLDPKTKPNTKLLKTNKDKKTVLQKLTKSPKPVRQIKEVNAKNKTRSSNVVEVKTNTKNMNTQKNSKVTNKKNAKADLFMNSNVSVKNSARNKANISNVTAKHDRTFNMTLRSTSLSRTFSPVLNNTRTR